MLGPASTVHLVIWHRVPGMFRRVDCIPSFTEVYWTRGIAAHSMCATSVAVASHCSWRALAAGVTWMWGECGAPVVRSHGGGLAGGADALPAVCLAV